MKKNSKYEPAEVELIMFDLRDVITTSNESSGALGEGEGGSPVWDTNGWT